MLILLKLCAVLWKKTALTTNGKPAGPLERWLISFPSFGFLFSVAREDSAKTIALFQERGIACARVGQMTASPSMILSYRSAGEIFRSKI
jgi:uncharacterized protein